MGSCMNQGVSSGKEVIELEETRPILKEFESLRLLKGCIFEYKRVQIATMAGMVFECLASAISFQNAQAMTRDEKTIVLMVSFHGKDRLLFSSHMILDEMPFNEFTAGIRDIWGVNVTTSITYVHENLCFPNRRRKLNSKGEMKRFLDMMKENALRKKRLVLR